MQEHLQRTRLGAALDEAGGTLLLLAGSLLFYGLLWGVRPASALAGAATFALSMLLRARTRAGRLQRREARLRRRIGGELKLEEWTNCLPRRAHLEAAELLAGALPLALLRAEEAGALCASPATGERWLVACAQLPAGEKLSARDVAAFQRACRRHAAARGCLCGAGASQGAQEQASLAPPVALIGRERMIALAGAAFPATDRQLAELGRRARLPRLSGRLARTALDARRTKKYLAYGLLLAGLYIVSGRAFYLAPGLACLLMMTLCRLLGREETL